jgi:putative ABC transport system permease protein
LFSNAVSYDRFRLFVLASILILLVSSLNFLNLTLAVEQQGAKEQILHQLVGASKSQLLGSNLKRSAGLAIVVSLLAVVFVEITQSIASTYVPELKEGSGVLSQRYAAWAVGVFVGVVGISSFSWWIINGRVQLNLGQSVDQRFSMSLQGYFSVFVQSLVSCLLISVGAMLLVQNHIWVTGNHGYDERNRLTFNVTRLNDELESQLNNFVGTMKNDTRVESVVRSSWRPFAKSRSMIALRGARHTSEDEMYIIDSIRAGDDFFNLWDIEIIVGEVPLGFNSTLGKSRPTRVVLTEEAAYSLGYKDSSYALGEVLYAGDDSFEVVAVSQNFQLGPISQQRSAAIILPQESSGNYVTVLSSQLSTNQILDLWRSLSDKEVIVESVESLKMNEYEADTQLGRMLMGAGVLSGLFCLIGIIAVSVLELKKLLPDMTTMRILGASEVDMGAHFLKFTVVPVILGALACAVIITSPLANPVHVLIMGSSLDIRIGYLSIGLLVSIATLTILLIYVALRPVELSLAARSD